MLAGRMARHILLQNDVSTFEWCKRHFMARRRMRLGIAAATESHSETDRNGKESLSTRIRKSEEQNVVSPMTEKGVPGVVGS